jgi:hypothetical protein
MRATYQQAGIFAISGFVCIVLLAQAYTSLTASTRFGVPFAAYPAEWGWPFLAYPMYKRSHHVGERLGVDYNLYAVTSTKRIRLDRKDLGLEKFWLFFTAVARPMIRGETEAVASLLSTYCPQFQEKSIAFELDDLGYSLGESGLVEGNPETVASMKIKCPE